MSNFLTRILHAADEMISTEPVWPVPATTIADIDQLRRELDGAIGAEYHATQRAHHLEKELGRVAQERDQYAGVVQLLCVGAVPETGEPAGTPIGDQLAKEFNDGRGFEGWN